MVLGAGLPIYGGRRTGAVSTPSMLRVDFDRWGQTPEDLRQLATSAAHRRTRERFLALYEVTQASCATRVAARTRRHPLPRDRGRPRRGRPRRPARRGGGAASRGRPGAALDLAAPGRLGGGEV